MWKNFCFCRLELAKKWELRGAPHIRTERNLRVLGKFCFANFINVGKISSGMENIHGFVNSLKVFSSSWCLFSTLSRTPFSLVYTFLNLKCLSTLSLHFSSIRRKFFWYESRKFFVSTSRRRSTRRWDFKLYWHKNEPRWWYHFDELLISPALHYVCP